MKKWIISTPVAILALIFWRRRQNQENPKPDVIGEDTANLAALITAMLALLAATHGVANAQNAARWSWQEPQAKVLPASPQWARP